MRRAALRWARQPALGDRRGQPAAISSTRPRSTTLRGDQTLFARRLVEEPPPGEGGDHDRGLAQRGDVPDRGVADGGQDEGVGRDRGQARAEAQRGRGPGHLSRDGPPPADRQDEGGGDGVGRQRGEAVRRGVGDPGAVGIDQGVGTDDRGQAERGTHRRAAGRRGERGQPAGHDGDRHPGHRRQVVGQQERATERRDHRAAAAGQGVDEREVAVAVREREEQEVRDVDQP